MDKYNVMVVEDQIMPRQLFEMIINSSDNYNLAVSIDSAQFADIYCLKNKIDLILMDVVTKGGASGLEASRRIKEQNPNIKIIIVTSMPEFSYLDEARSIGVDSFWYKDISKESILNLMDETMKGNSIYPDKTPEIMLGQASSYDFTKRELEVLKEMTGGYTNPEIADHLYISVGTVKSHILSMLEKTGFKNRTELAVRARESGLVILSDSDNN